jgi:hypothetical protein
VPPTRTAIAAEAISPFIAPNAKFVRVPFASIVYDDMHEFALDTSRFVASHAGDYQVCASLAGAQTVSFELDLYVNGFRERPFASGKFIASGCRSIRLSPQDFVEVWLYQQSGADQMFVSTPFADWLTIQEDRPAQVNVIAVSEFMAPSAVFTKVPYTTEAFDSINEFDPSTSQYTASQDGDYQVCGSLSIGGGVGFELDLFKNAVRERVLAVGYGLATGCRVIRLVAGDRVTVHMYQNTVTAATIRTDVWWDWLTIRQVSADTSVGNTIGFTVPSSTFVTVPYASEIFDDHDRYNPATYRYAVELAGDYEVCASVFDNYASNNRIQLELDIVKAGARDKTIGLREGAASGCSVTRAAAGDALEVQLYSLSTATMTLSPNASWNWLTVRAIR